MPTDEKTFAFEVGQPVEKFTGEARWSGVVVSRYHTTRGGERYVVEVKPQGFQMIAVPSQLRAALEAAEAGAVPVAWSDIASAPKDGTWVLLKGGEPDECYDFDAPKPPCVVAQWVDVSYSDGRPGSGRWHFARYDSGYYGRWLDPTHWLPLASPPIRDEAAWPIETAPKLDGYQIEAKVDGWPTWAVVFWSGVDSRWVCEDENGDWIYYPVTVWRPTAIRARGER